MEVVEEHFMQDLTVDDFEPLQRKLLVFKPQIYQRYEVLRQKSDKVDRFWFQQSE